MANSSGSTSREWLGVLLLVTLGQDDRRSDASLFQGLSAFTGGPSFDAQKPFSGLPALAHPARLRSFRWARQLAGAVRPFAFVEVGPAPLLWLRADRCSNSATEVPR